MALSEKVRSSIYLQFTQLLGEEEAAALLSQLPARDIDEPVTKEFLRAEIADVHTEIAEVRAEIAGVRTELRSGLGDVRVEIAGLEARMNERFQQQTMWMAGTLVAGMGVAAAVASLVG